MQGLIEKFTLPDDQQEAARGVQNALHGESGPFLRTASGSDVAIPAELAQLFETLANAAAHGQQITVSIGDPRLRPRQAAEELGMSRTYLCKLMDENVIEFERVGTHRRIAMSEVERYRRVRATQLAARYVDATQGLPDVDDEPMSKLEGPAPRRPRPAR